MSGFPIPPTVSIVDKEGRPTQYFLNYLFNGLFTGVIATAAVTTGGTAGSMTFVNGRLTEAKAAT